MIKVLKIINIGFILDCTRSFPVSKLTEGWKQNESDTIAIETLSLNVTKMYVTIDQIQHKYQTVGVWKLLCN